jgi:hypothetical protein
MKIVISGTYAQYLNYLRETGETPQTAKFVNNTEQLRGLENADVVRYGTWWINPVAHEDEIIRRGHE